MHFASRLQAGRALAEQLVPKYRYENCAVVALDDGGAMVGAQIAMRLHCVLTMLVRSEIMLADEEEPVAGVVPGGAFSFNHSFSQQELDRFVHEFYGYGYFEQEKLNRLFDLNHLIGTGGVIKKELLKGHHVIFVSEALKNGFPIDLADAFLKPIAIEKFIVAAPVASVEAVGRMHSVADEIYCLDTVTEFEDTVSYFDKQDVPDHETVLKTIQDIVLKWK